jgi:imidazoleglycerol phosphate synthase cyclase subunit
MLKTRIIPCLDVRAGRVVKGVRFGDLRDQGDPASLAARYEHDGADELTVLDVSATTEERAASVTIVRAIRERIGIPLTVGGGVRSRDDVARLLDAGADKVAINSAALADPALLTRCAETFGSQCMVIAIDARRIGDSWMVVTHSGSRFTHVDAVNWAQESVSRGAGEILLTSWDRDGTRSGYDLSLLAAVAACARAPLIASGGASSALDMYDAIQAGADAVLAASIFHQSDFTVQDVKRELQVRGTRIRT